MRRHAPDGSTFPPEAYVFGNEVGQPVKRVSKAWATACREAGIVGLQLRDLRREFGSQLLEADVPAHVVRDLLGHANVTTTSRYLATTGGAQRRALD